MNRKEDMSRQEAEGVGKVCGNCGGVGRLAFNCLPDGMSCPPCNGRGFVAPRPERNRPELLPIEDAPEGVAFILFHDGKMSAPLGRKYKRDEHFIYIKDLDSESWNISDISGQISTSPRYTCTLWPVTPTKPNSWDEYTDFKGIFDATGFRFIAPNAPKDSTYIGRLYALRDFLNHHYPPIKE